MGVLYIDGAPRYFVLHLTRLVIIKCVGIYLIFHLDLNYIMGSQRQWTVFELLEILFAVNMQLYVCRKKIGIIQGSFGNFIH